VVACLACLLTACGPKGGSDAAADKAPPVLLLADEDLRRVGAADELTGPVVTGSIQPERRADLRADVQAFVAQVLKENGETVRRGDVLVRLDDSAIRESLASAQEAVRAATQAYEQAERQVERQKTLQAQGMTSTQALEDAEVRRNGTQSDLVAAKAKVAMARQQLERTEVRAPFDGIVSDRKVSAGDTAQVGKELLKVIDPTSMRFEGLVVADRMAELKAGQRVEFRISGFNKVDYVGHVKRVDASADSMTRQVSVLVSFDGGAEPPRVAGLYAEGRILTGSTRALVVPEASLERSGDSAFVWRVRGAQLQKVAVKLGERDARRGEYPVLAGLAEGDRVLRNPRSTLVDGQKVEFAAAKAGAVAAASAPASAK